jgi:hypothetical protein
MHGGVDDAFQPGIFRDERDRLKGPAIRECPTFRLLFADDVARLEELMRQWPLNPLVANKFLT